MLENARVPLISAMCVRSAVQPVDWWYIRKHRMRYRQVPIRNQTGNVGMVNFKKARERMVETQIAARGIRDERVIEAMGKVPRHLFVDEALRDQAYSDHPLPIAENQTISQPYVVALMTESLELNGSEKVLEIGTGSGYQSAVLAELADRVFSIERHPDLAYRANSILQNLGYKNVIIRVGDGSLGWPDDSPFDGISNGRLSENSSAACRSARGRWQTGCSGRRPVRSGADSGSANGRGYQENKSWRGSVRGPGGEMGMERIEIGSPIIGVIGPGTGRPDLAKLAEEVGREV